MNSIKKLIVVVTPVLTIFLLHYVAANLYVKMCAELTLLGFIKSLVTTGSPVCNTLLSVVNITHNSYALLITGLIGGLLTYVASLNIGYVKPA